NPGGYSLRGFETVTAAEEESLIDAFSWAKAEAVHENSRKCN
ncbi:MAG: hypothetical protein JWM35_1140, partial [Verrucomicrobia bacterium]|nr:hypothetical protein [Verrucomicrobiota bacterium]